MSIKTSNNHIGIFCDHGPKNWQITQQGLLANKRLAVKDVFAVKNERYLASINLAGSASIILAG
ncbi:MAG: hypothetical protein ACTJFM_13285, partial [Pseudoalteromonas sp.]